jgi:hypothetical protein
MTINFDSILQGIENANFDLMERVRSICDEAEEIQTNYDELLECLGATNHTSALDAIRAMKAALGTPYLDPEGVELPAPVIEFLNALQQQP